VRARKKEEGLQLSLFLLSLFLLSRPPLTSKSPQEPHQQLRRKKQRLPAEEANPNTHSQINIITNPKKKSKTQKLYHNYELEQSLSCMLSFFLAVK
jgi:hypothetical protein